jgi:bacterioferritin
MKGSPQVIETLNRALTSELTAINQYFCQSKRCAYWGYARLARKHYEGSLGEMRQAEQIVGRILFLQGTPEIGRYDVIRVGGDVKEHLENDLKLELGGVRHYNQAVALCSSVADHGTRAVLESILAKSKQRVDWLETQVHLIDTVGVQNYLAAQFGQADEPEGRMSSRRRRDSR